jgi:hypothetical protein
VIIWRGWGIVVIGLALLAALAAGAVAEMVKADDYGTGLLLGLFLIPIGVLTWFVGKRMNRDTVRNLVDPKTGEAVTVRNDHSLFFLRVEWWGPILAVAGLVVVISGLLSQGR